MLYTPDDLRADNNAPPSASLRSIVFPGRFCVHWCPDWCGAHPPHKPAQVPELCKAANCRTALTFEPQLILLSVQQHMLSSDNVGVLAQAAL